MRGITCRQGIGTPCGVRFSASDDDQLRDAYTEHVRNALPETEATDQQLVDDILVFAYDVVESDPPRSAS